VIVLEWWCIHVCCRFQKDRQLISSTDRQSFIIALIYIFALQQHSVGVPLTDTSYMRVMLS